MKMPLKFPKSIRDSLSNSANRSGRYLRSATAHVRTGDLLCGTGLGCPLTELSGRSILITTREQLTTAMALIELDGVASRLIICPPDTPVSQFPSLIARGGVDAIVSDYELHDHDCPENILRVVCRSAVTPVDAVQPEHRDTEWVLLTSGTTGAPKMIVHNLGSLTGAIVVNQDVVSQEMPDTDQVVWGTFYDIRRYGGLQIFLRAVLRNASLVLSMAGEPVADHLLRLAARGVTHLSGTPSQWRRALMSPQAHEIAPRYVRLSGEIADQSILNALHSFYPNAAVAHAFASTEAGLAFEVNDGLAGFPSSLLGSQGEVEMRVVNDTLQIRSNRTGLRAMDAEKGSLADEEGFVDTGDIVELRGDRYYFLGRRNGVINVGGLKVYPEEVESVINRHPAVRMSMVRSRRNPFTGALVTADVVLKDMPEPGSVDDRTEEFKTEILEICRQSLAPHKIPTTIRCVPALRVAAAGKLVRGHA